MSEVNLPALAESDHARIESKAPTPMQEINLALKACTFGRFNVRLLITALFGFVAGVLVTNDTAFLLPIAECDLNMNLAQKGLLNAAPYFGMISSSILAGFLTDTFGRKIFILVGYAGIFILVLIAGTSQTYEVLLTAKMLQGVLFATSFSPVVTLTSEFCYNDIRDRVMLLQSSFAAMGQVIITSASWGILMNDWKYTLFGGYIVLNTWNFYLYIMSVFSLSALILYSFVPESPKFLLTKERYAEAREVLIKIYTENTGKAAETYPYVDIWKNKVEKINEESEGKVEVTLRHQLVMGLHDMKPIFRKPLVLHLVLLCTLNFVGMSLYNVFRLWFPQLSTVVEHYSFSTEEGSQDLCSMLDTYTRDVKEKINNMTASDVCVPKRSGTETYLNSLIVGCVCIVPYLVSSFLVNKVGKKRLLFTAGLISSTMTLSLRWANYKSVVVALFAVDIGISQFNIGLLQATAVELFNTATRTLAFSFMMAVGRLGTLFGNIAFPILLEKGCIIPFFTLGGMMMGAMLLTLLLPTKKK